MREQEIFEVLKTTISELMDVDSSKITLETNLYEDLDMDSIDAIDLAAKIREVTGKRVDPEDFKKVRTIKDLVDTATKLFSK